MHLLTAKRALLSSKITFNRAARGKMYLCLLSNPAHRIGFSVLICASQFFQLIERTEKRISSNSFRLFMRGCVKN